MAKSTSPSSLDLQKIDAAIDRLKKENAFEYSEYFMSLVAHYTEDATYKPFSMNKYKAYRLIDESKVDYNANKIIDTVQEHIFYDGIALLFIIAAVTILYTLRRYLKKILYYISDSIPKRAGIVLFFLTITLFLFENSGFFRASHDERFFIFYIPFFISFCLFSGGIEKIYRWVVQSKNIVNVHKVIEDDKNIHTAQLNNKQLETLVVSAEFKKQEENDVKCSQENIAKNSDILFAERVKDKSFFYRYRLGIVPLWKIFWSSVVLYLLLDFLPPLIILYGGLPIWYVLGITVLIRVLQVYLCTKVLGSIKYYAGKKWVAKITKIFLYFVILYSFYSLIRIFGSMSALLSIGT